MPQPPALARSLSPSVSLSLFKSLAAPENTKTNLKHQRSEEVDHAPVPRLLAPKRRLRQFWAPDRTERLLCISLCPGRPTLACPRLELLFFETCRHCDFELHFSSNRKSPSSLAAWLTSGGHNGRQNKSLASTCFDVVCLPSVLAHRSQRFLLLAETRDSIINFFRNSPLGTLHDCPRVQVHGRHLGEPFSSCRC